jgi:colanic acid/amylovoran biosynthesis glycosyltransferase
MKKGLRIAICAPNQHSGSETFIANHIAHLPSEIFFLYGGWLPLSYNGKPLSACVSKSASQRIIKDLFRRKVVQDSKENILKKFLIENKINVVLCEYGVTGVHVGRVCLEAGIPFVVHFHGFDAYHKDTISQYTEKYRSVLNKSAAVIAVSVDMKKQLVNIGIEESKIHLIHYGVDTSLFNPSERTDFSYSFIGVGRFVSKKAPHLTILAFAKVLKEFPAARLTLIGDPGLGNSPELLITCKQLVKALNISDRVIFPGWMPHAEIAQMMKESEVFVQHSVISDSGDSEGTPNTVIEASASGICVIATRHGGIPDVVHHGETGYLCNEFDVNEMSELMIAALRNPSETKRMGRVGAELVKRNFDLAQQLNKLYLVLERAK